LTWPEVIGWRLARHHLLDSGPAASLVEVTSAVGGVHPQVAASSELMLGLRVPGTTRMDVRTAVWGTRTLVKTVGLRGTLHVLPAGELLLWMAANRLRFPAEERRLASAWIDLDELQAVVRAPSAATSPRSTSMVRGGGS
jgi:winged helix DNA-binding protein